MSAIAIADGASSRKITRLIADSIIASPAFAPTDRSNPATTRLIVTAQAMIVTIEMPRRMANPFATEANAGWVSVKNTISPR